MYKEGAVSCGEWTYLEFIQCIDAKMREEVTKAGFRCHTIWWKKYFEASSPPCANGDEAEIVRFSTWLEDHEQFLLKLISRPYAYGCPLPCLRSEFGLDCRENFNGNSFKSLEVATASSEAKTITLSMKMNVETEEQILIHDFASIVAGVGGSLGLFLGFSCLQALLPLTDKVASRLVGK